MCAWPHHSAEPLHTQASPHRQSSAEAFGARQNIRPHTEMLPCIELARPAHAGLHLVENQEDILFPAEL